MSKPHATTDECLLLVCLKREKALAAMKEILLSACQTQPGHADILLILEYLTNMVYCLEIMLKVLSGNWNSHNVGLMYEKVYGKPHASEALMDGITVALRDQKYLFEPNGGLLSQVGDLEKLYDQLRRKLHNAYKTFGVSQQIPAPESFVAYLRDNVARFYSEEEGPTLFFEGGKASPAAMAKFKAAQSKYFDELSRGLHNKAQEIRSHLDKLIAEDTPLVFFIGRGGMI
jgi:hypothetical protein